MAPFFIKPENALKRAEELIAVGQQGSATQALYDVIHSKHHRKADQGMENVVLKFIELCVNLRRGKLAKEALHQYKKNSQTVNLASFELVVRRFLELSEAKVSSAQAQADKISIDNIEDLEASETPESLMMSSVSGEDSRDRTDREVVTPWLKFLWETYRTVLEILRNNANFEPLYQNTAQRAFQFCLKYTRKNELRRLCEMLRTHLNNLSKHDKQPHSIDLRNPESLNMHLETRFAQLSAATELDLWQEAFRSIEDIHSLLMMTDRVPNSKMLITYFEKLTKIFLVADNLLFHASSWNEYFTHVKAQSKPPSEEELQRVAVIVLVSILAIPVSTSAKGRVGYAEYDEVKNKANRLANLLGLQRSPSRASLLKEAINKGILQLVPQEIRDLYNILEVKFHPLSICQKLEPILHYLQKSDATADPATVSKYDLSRYVRPLQNVVLARLLQQLSQVYKTVHLDFIAKLANFSAPNHLDAITIEKFIMDGCKKGEFQIRLNHMTKSLSFVGSSLADGHEDQNVQGTSSDIMRTHLIQLAQRLNKAVMMVDPSVVSTYQNEKKKMFADILSKVDEEHQAALERKKVIEREKERVELEYLRKSEAEKRRKAEQQRAAEAAEKTRVANELKRVEEERRKKEREEIERQEKLKIAKQLDQIAQATGRKLEVIENLDEMSKDDLLKKQMEQLEADKKLMQNKLKGIGKKNDHTIRAFRVEEIPLYREDHERQRKEDLAIFEKAYQESCEVAKKTFETNLATKNRMARMLDDFNALKAQILSVKKEECARLEAQNRTQLEAEKEKRRADKRAKRADEKRRQEELEREKRIKEQQEAARRAEEEEKARIKEQERLERLEQRKKQEEIAARQRQREEEIEEKRRQRERESEEKQRQLREEERMQRESFKRPPVAASPAESGPWVRGAALQSREPPRRGDDREESRDGPRRYNDREDPRDGPRRFNERDGRDAPRRNEEPAERQWRRDVPPRDARPDERRRDDGPRDDRRRDDGPRDDRRRDDGPRDDRRRDDGPREDRRRDDGPRDDRRRDDGPRRDDRPRQEDGPWVRREVGRDSGRDSGREPNRDDSSRRDFGRDQNREPRRDEGGWRRAEPVPASQPASQAAQPQRPAQAAPQAAPQSAPKDEDNGEWNEVKRERRDVGAKRGGARK